MENSLLIKCLECRLIGAPPKFTMGPPPALPAEFLTTDLLQSLNFVENRQLARQLKNIKLKRCHLVQSHPIDVDSSNLASIQHQEMIDHSQIALTQEQSILVFLISFLLFLIVLTIAGIFTIKLIRVRRQFKEFKSLNKTSSTASSSTNMSKSNTITSELVLTPKMLDNNNTTFYNQLFEATKQVSSSSNSSNSSNSPKQQPPTYQHYLQAVPSCSGLFAYNQSRLNLLGSSSSSSSTSSQPTCEYDEINSQAYSATCPNAILQPIWYPSVHNLNQFQFAPNQFMFYPVKQQQQHNTAAANNNNVIMC